MGFFHQGGQTSQIMGWINCNGRTEVSKFELCSFCIYFLAISALLSSKVSGLGLSWLTPVKSVFWYSSVEVFWGTDFSFYLQEHLFPFPLYKTYSLKDCLLFPNTPPHLKRKISALCTWNCQVFFFFLKSAHRNKAIEKFLLAKDQHYPALLSWRNCYGK